LAEIRIVSKTTAIIKVGNTQIGNFALSFFENFTIISPLRGLSYSESTVISTIEPSFVAV
jgi:hypothetical protein